jgi:hypothetical protein
MHLLVEMHKVPEKQNRPAGVRRGEFCSGSQRLPHIERFQGTVASPLAGLPDLGASPNPS